MHVLLSCDNHSVVLTTGSSEFEIGVVVVEYILVGNGGKELKVTVCDCRLQIKSIMQIGSRVLYAKWHRIFVYMIIFGSKI